MAQGDKIEKLTEFNFPTWKDDIRYLLDKAGYLEITESPPDGSYDTWDRETQARARSALLLLKFHISKGLKPRIAGARCASEAWDLLRGSYQGQSVARKLHLEQEFASLKMYESETVGAYFTRVEDARDKLVEAGEVITVDKMKFRLIHGLTEDFQAMAHAKLEYYMSEDRSIGDVLADLQLFQQKLAVTARKQPAKVKPLHGAAANNKETRKCHICKQPGHLKANCPERRGKSAGNDKTKCGYCGKAGHREDDCYRKKKDTTGGGTSREPIMFGNVALPGNASKLLKPYDREDFMLDPEILRPLLDKYGPFDLDGAADEAGTNAQCGDWCYRDGDSFLERDVSGLAVYLNPPFRQACKFLSHYMAAKMREPETTSGLFILPYDTSADWWPLVKHMLPVELWREGTQLFTLPPNDLIDPDAKRRVLRPCHFDVVALYDAPRDRTLPMAMSARMDPPFMIDSGAAAHYVSTPEYLHEYVPERIERHMCVGDGRELLIAGRGKLVFRSADRELMTILSDVYHVPGLAYNLLSESKIVKLGCESITTAESKVFRSPNGHVVMQGRGHGDVYHVSGFDLEVPTNPVAAVVNEPPTRADRWHQRLGHLSYTSMLKMLKMVDGMDVTPDELKDKIGSEDVCGDCQIGRQTRNPRTESTGPKATEPLMRLHTDLCGPIGDETDGGQRYFLSVIDEATRYSVVRTLRKKSEAIDELLKIIELLEKSKRLSVLSIRCDGGGEYMSTRGLEELAQRGIRVESTQPYSPESNGMAERFNRTIMERVRSMLSASGLPPCYWDEAVYYANDLRNVSPATGLDITPYEAMHGRRPNVSKFHTFGCLVYAHIPSELRKKLDARAERGVFLGYRGDSRIARVLVDDKIRETADVVFDETKKGYPELFAETEAPTADTHPMRGGHVDGNGGSDDERSDGQDADDNADKGAGGAIEIQATTDDNSLLDRGDGGNADLYNPAADDDDDDSGDAGGRGSSYELRSLQRVDYRGMTVTEPKAVRYEDPKSFKEAMAGPDAEEWRQACQAEIDACLSNDTWKIVKKPVGVKILPCKWVLKTKFLPDGCKDRRKGRIVVGGHRQVDGVDYAEVYAPVGRFATLRALLAKAAFLDMDLEMVDISNAFLNGELDIPVYMEQPEGFETHDNTYCCELKKTLYGLKQAPREWYSVLKTGLSELGLTQSENDQALWYGTGKFEVYVVHWVDDLIIASTDAGEVKRIKEGVLKKFKGRDLGSAETYLNIHIERDRKARTIKISLPKHVEDALERFNMTDAYPRTVPMSPGADITRTTTTDKDLEFGTPYSECVGVLMYLAAVTRPDICLAASMLARNMSNPSARHWDLCKGVLKYLAGTKDAGIIYGRTDTGLEGWTDADYATCKETRKSRGGYVFTLYGGAISWSSKQQSVVATSSAESEYIAGAWAAREAVWLKRICSDLRIDTGEGVKLNADNQAAIKMATNDADSTRTKHIDVAYHYLRNSVLRGMVRMFYVNTGDNAADAFTKPLAEAKFSKHMVAIGVK